MILSFWASQRVISVVLLIALCNIISRTADEHMMAFMPLRVMMLSKDPAEDADYIISVTQSVRSS